MSDANVPPVFYSATADISLRIGGHQLKTKVTVPTGDVRLKTLLPVMQQLSSTIVQIGEQNVENAGQKISCQKGCGACCRQLVPIAPVETHGIRDLVESMPEPRKTEIRRRFAEAKERLATSGMWQKLEERASWPHEDVLNVGLDYFRLGIACPFLEDESCSIHLDRPMACREYLVTSPAANCANPTPEGVEWVPIPAKVWTEVARMEEGEKPGTYVPWVPLTQALDYAATHEEGPARPGTEWVREVFSRLARTNKVPAANIHPSLAVEG